MGPNSRPPLTTRIRASLERRRSSSRTRSQSQSRAQSSDGTALRKAPPDDYVYPPIDPDSLRNAINAAINGEAFQNAIANNLAKVVKPNIKIALDTIQPVIEAVYLHDELLKETSASLERLMSRVEAKHEKYDVLPQASSDDLNTHKEAALERKLAGESSDLQKTASTRSDTVFAESQDAVTANGMIVDIMKAGISDHHNESNLQRMDDISKMVEGNNKMLTDLLSTVENVKSTLQPLKEQIISIQAAGEQSTTATSVMQAQLDQLQADVNNILAAVGNDLGGKVKALQKSVAEQSSTSLSTHERRLDSISVDVTKLKMQDQRLETLQKMPKATEELLTEVAECNSKLNSILGGINIQSERNTKSHSDVIFALKTTHDLHAAHSATLSKLSDRPSTSNTHEYQEIVQSLEVQTSDLASLRNNVNARLDTIGTNFSTLGTRIDTLLDIVESIKDGEMTTHGHPVRGMSQFDDAETEHLGAEHERSAAPIVPSPNTSLEPHLENIIKTLDLHTATLATIHNAPHPDDLSTITTNTASLSPKLDRIISVLLDLKDSDVSAEILTAIHGINDIVLEIKEGDVSDEILTQLHDSNESHGNHNVLLSAIHANSEASLESLAQKNTAAIEWGAKTVGPGVDLSGVESQLDLIIDNLDAQKMTIGEIKASSRPEKQRVEELETLKSNHGDLVTRIGELKNLAEESRSGVVANGKSIDALQEYTKAANGDVKSAHASLQEDLKNWAKERDDRESTATDEGNWMKRPSRRAFQRPDSAAGESMLKEEGDDAAVIAPQKASLVRIPSRKTSSNRGEDKFGAAAELHDGPVDDGPQVLPERVRGSDAEVAETVESPMSPSSGENGKGSKKKGKKDRDREKLEKAEKKGKKKKELFTFEPDDEPEGEKEGREDDGEM